LNLENDHACVEKHSTAFQEMLHKGIWKNLFAFILHKHFCEFMEELMISTYDIMICLNYCSIFSETTPDS